MAWRMVFKTTSGRGNLTIAKHLKFDDGFLEVRDNVDRALILLQKKSRGVDFDVVTVEGDVPGVVQEAYENSPYGTLSQGVALPERLKQKGVEMTTSVRATEPDIPGLDVVERQPEEPSEDDVIIPKEFGGPDVDVHIPEVSLDGDSDLMLLDREDLEVMATDLEIPDVEDFRNDDLLIEAILEKRAAASGEAKETVETPEIDEADGADESDEIKEPGGDEETETGDEQTEEVEDGSEPGGSEVESVPGDEGSGGTVSTDPDQ